MRQQCGRALESEHTLAAGLPRPFAGPYRDPPVTKAERFSRSQRKTMDAVRSQWVDSGVDSP